MSLETVDELDVLAVRPEGMELAELDELVALDLGVGTEVAMLDEPCAKVAVRPATPDGVRC